MSDKFSAATNQCQSKRIENFGTVEILSFEVQLLCKDHNSVYELTFYFDVFN